MKPLLMKVVFLEVDGVLNCGPRWKELRRVVNTAGGRLDPDAVKRLKRLVDTTDARIVVSSMWRLGCMAQLTSYLQRHGIGHGRVIGKTPDRSRALRGPNCPSVRCEEIKTWLAAHPEVERFVILDKEADMGDLSPRLVKTTWNDGLLDEHVDRAIAMLMQPVEAQSLHPATLTEPQPFQ